MRIVERRGLDEIYPVGPDPRPICGLGFAIIEHGYDQGLLQTILEDALRLEGAAGQEFLSLRHLREAQERIPAVAELMNDRRRLRMLSGICGVELEPYPITTAAAHINYYEPGRIPIAFHTDGAAMVELIPLLVEGGEAEGATLIYKDLPERGEAVLQGGSTLPAEAIAEIHHRPSRSILLQGRRILHSARTLRTGRRVTLVFAMRSAVEPWKDDNSLMRLMLDDPLERIQEEWLRDVNSRKLPAYREMLARRASGHAKEFGDA